MMNSENITVKIKTLNSTTFPVQVFKDNTIQEFKVAIFHKVRIHSMNQRLIYQGKVLKDNSTIRENKIEDGDVVHLVETDNRNYQNPPNPNERNRNNNENEYNRLMSSLFPNFTEFLGERNNNNNNNNNRNNINTEGVYDSFKHFMLNKKYNFTQSAEVLTQNINNLFNMIDNQPEITLKNNERLSYLYDDKCDKFKIGQWIDIKDANDNWIEGQILSIQGDKVNVHYLGFSSNMNEWINIKSDRLAIFRTYTSQDLTSKYLSCYPNKKEEFNENSNNITSIFYTSTKKFDPINNELIMLIDVIKEKIIKILNANAKFKKNQFENKEELFNYERYENLLKMQLYPLFDRFGRILVDLGNYLMFQTYNFFEDNISLFRKNIQNESLRFMNIYDTPEVVSRNRLIHFQKLVKFSILKNKSNGDNERNDNQNNNNDRPRYGIMVNFRSFQQTREEERRNQMQRARRYMVGRENFQIISRRINYNDINNNNSEESKSIDNDINKENQYCQTDWYDEQKFRILLIDKNVNSFIMKGINKSKVNNNSTSLQNTTKPVIKEKISINVRDKDSKVQSRTNTLTKSVVTSKKNSFSSSRTGKFRLSTSKGKIGKNKK